MMTTNCSPGHIAIGEFGPKVQACVISADEWAKNPDSGVDKLLAAYRADPERVLAKAGHKPFQWLEPEKHVKRERRVMRDPSCYEATQGGKVCRRCLKEKTLSEFSRRRSCTDGLNPYCRACCSIMARQAKEKKKASEEAARCEARRE